MCLDVVRVDSAGGEQKAAVCYAAYGYLGDVMHRSEAMRALGPARYSLAGAVTLLRGRSYNVKISYIPAPDLGSAPA